MSSIGFKTETPNDHVGEFVIGSKYVDGKTKLLTLEIDDWLSVNRIDDTSYEVKIGNIPMIVSIKDGVGEITFEHLANVSKLLE